jgi:hypothetical protein
MPGGFMSFYTGDFVGIGSESSIGGAEPISARAIGS